MPFKSKFCRYCKNSFEPMGRSLVYCSLKCRFWSKVIKRGPDECWDWTASKIPKGYGMFKYKGHLVKAHRFVWFLTYGSIPGNLHVLHKCDNESCCNPSHIFLGTQTDNSIDMVRKFRQWNQKLTQQQVKTIKIELAKGIIHRLLAKKYKVARQTIGKINTGECWSHVTI